MDGADVVREELEARERALRDVRARRTAMETPLRAQRSGIEDLDAETARVGRDLDRERREVLDEERRLAGEIEKLRRRTREGSSQQIITPRSAQVGKRILAVLFVFRVLAAIWRRILKRRRA